MATDSTVSRIALGEKIDATCHPAGEGAGAPRADGEGLGEGGESLAVDFLLAMECCKSNSDSSPVGDCPDFAAGTIRRMVEEQNGTVPFSETSRARAAARQRRI